MADDAVRTRLLQRMHELQPDYHSATKELSDLGSLDPLLYGVYRGLSSYKAGDGADKAIYIIGRFSALLENFGKLYEHVAAYRDAQHKLEEYDMRKAIENG